jgi:hypothetical protein
MGNEGGASVSGKLRVCPKAAVRLRGKHSNHISSLSIIRTRPLRSRLQRCQRPVATPLCHSAGGAGDIRCE